jgi:hypothetical protein
MTLGLSGLEDTGPLIFRARRSWSEVFGEKQKSFEKLSIGATSVEQQSGTAEIGIEQAKSD